MKKILFILSILASAVAFGQSTGYFRYDTVTFQKIGGNSEFNLLNATRSVTGGVLTNIGNGRTNFVAPPWVSTRDRFGFSGEDVQSTGARAFHGNNQSFTMWGMGLETKLHTYPTSLGTRTVGISNSNGVDSAFVLVQGTTTGGQLRTVRAGVNSTDSSKTVELLMRVTSGLPTASLTIKNVRNISGSVALDSNKAYLYRQDLNAVGQPYLTNIYCLDDTLGLYSVNVISAYSKAAYQSATDSLFWGLTNRDASLTFNSDGWHAWQTLGEYYFYNVQRITDTTGLDILAWDRAESEMVRVPSDLVGGAGGGSSPPFADNAALVKNNADNSKLLILSAANISAATTRTWTFPDVNGTVARNDAAQTFAGRQTFGAQAKFDAGFSVAGNYAANEGFMIGYDAGSNMATLIAYDGGYKDIRVISNVLTLYGGGSNPGVLINGSGNVVMGSTTAADATEKLTVVGNVRFSGALMPNNLPGTSGQILQSAGAGAPPTWASNTLQNMLQSVGGGDVNGANAVSGDGSGDSFTWNFFDNYVINSDNIEFTNKTGIGTTSATSLLHVNGSFATAYRAITALRTLDITDHTIEVTANTFTVTLPTAVGIAGRQYVITNSGAGTTTIATTSSQTFINVTATPTTLTLNQFSTVTVVSNGANWLRTSSL